MMWGGLEVQAATAWYKLFTNRFMTGDRLTVQAASSLQQESLITVQGPGLYGIGPDGQLTVRAAW